MQSQKAPLNISVPTPDKPCYFKVALKSIPTIPLAVFDMIQLRQVLFNLINLSEVLQYIVSMKNREIFCWMRFILPNLKEWELACPSDTKLTISTQKPSC